MLHIATSIFSLLLGTALLLNGVGLLGTLVGLRATAEGFSVVMIGAVMSAYFIGFSVGSWLCPALIRQVGHIRAFAAFATVASATAIAYPLYVDPVPWLLLRISTGLTLAGIFMSIESWLNVIAPNQIRGQLFSIYTAITLLSMGTGQYLLLLGNVADYDLFVIITILISLSILPIVLTRVSQPEEVETPNLSLRRLISISPLGLITTFIAGIISGGFWGMGPVFAEHITNNGEQVAIFMSLVIFGGALLQWPIGRLSDLIDRKKVILVVCLVAGCLAVFAYQAIHISLYWFYLIMFFFGGTAFTIYALGVAHVNDLLASNEVLEATRGLLLVYGLGAAIGPLLAAQFMQTFGNIHLLGFFALNLLMLGFYTIYRLFAGKSVPADEQSEFVPMVRTSTVVLEMAPQINNKKD